MKNPVTLHFDLKRWEKAETLEEYIVQRSKRTLGTEHPSTQIIMRNLEAIYMELGKLDQAESTWRS